MFRFLKYLQPTHYFSIARKDGSFIFPDIAKLSSEIRTQLTIDTGFKSNEAAQYDLSWQAINSGYIGGAETYHSFEKIPVKDEYRFVKKYFHPVWGIYILLIRLISLKNPIAEISGWIASKNVTRFLVSKSPLDYPEYAGYTSQLIASSPLVTVVIPTLNRYEYLEDVLRDFEKQTYKNFEILVVDQSQPYQQDFYLKYNLNIRPVRQEEPALWLARNTAIEQAKGTIIALSEDDVRVGENWIENHLKCLDFFNAEISAGVFFPEGSSIPQERSFFATASQFATGNAALYKTVFKQVGLFDRQFERQRMGDGEFGLRCYLAGIKSVSTPYASCVDVKAGTGGLREMGSWDAFRPKKWFAPRPVPSVLYLFRRYYGASNARWELLKTIPPSVIPYKFKKSKPVLVLGIIISLFVVPILLVQVFISWHKASVKISEGSKIRQLE